MTAMTGQPVAEPAEERRGGELPDWDNTRPGEPLPDLGDADPDPRYSHGSRYKDRCGG